MKNKYNQNNGFTLIELVIVITLLIILAGSALVNVTNFYQSQGTSDDSKSVISEFRSAYSKATSVFYPAGCTGLTGYTVSMSEGSKDINVSAVCAVNPSTSTKIGALKTSTFFDNYSFTIAVPSGSVSTPVDVVIVNDGNESVTSTIRAGSYGVFEIL